jgi:hypothetical protein
MNGDGGTPFEGAEWSLELFPVVALEREGRKLGGAGKRHVDRAGTVRGDENQSARKISHKPSSTSCLSHIYF